MIPVPIQPVTAAEIPEDWPGVVREIVIREGRAVRGNPVNPMIEIKSLSTNLWHPLGLPGGGTLFTDFGERNIILHKLVDR